MTARTINAMIKESEKCGQYVYAKTVDSMLSRQWSRISKAKTVNGVLKVKKLYDGKWYDLVDDSIGMM